MLHRHIAKNVVAAKLAKECLVQVSYAIGVAQPISVYVDTKGTGVIPDSKISKMIQKEVDLNSKRNYFKIKIKKTNLSKNFCLWSFWKK